MKHSPGAEIVRQIERDEIGGFALEQFAQVPYAAVVGGVAVSGEQRVRVEPDEVAAVAEGVVGESIRSWKPGAR
jgi:hypothetical protein